MTKKMSHYSNSIDQHDQQQLNDSLSWGDLDAQDAWDFDGFEPAKEKDAVAATAAAEEKKDKKKKDKKKENKDRESRDKDKEKDKDKKEKKKKKESKEKEKEKEGKSTRRSSTGAGSVTVDKATRRSSATGASSPFSSKLSSSVDKDRGSKSHHPRSSVSLLAVGSTSPSATSASAKTAFDNAFAQQAVSQDGWQISKQSAAAVNSSDNWLDASWGDPVSPSLRKKKSTSKRQLSISGSNSKQRHGGSSSRTLDTTSSSSEASSSSSSSSRHRQNNRNTVSEKAATSTMLARLSDSFGNLDLDGNDSQELFLATFNAAPEISPKRQQRPPVSPSHKSRGTPSTPSSKAAKNFLDEMNSSRNQLSFTKLYLDDENKEEDDDQHDDSKHAASKKSSKGKKEKSKKHHKKEVASSSSSSQKKKEENVFDQIDGMQDQLRKERKSFHDMVNGKDPAASRKKSNGGGDLFELINIDPFSVADSNYSDDDAIGAMIMEPQTCTRKQLFKGFCGEMYPLSMMCAIGADLSAIEACYQCHPDALKEKDMWVGTPLHYAVAYQAPPEVVKWLIEEDASALQATNKLRRTPYHMACLFNPRVEVLELLLAEDAEGLGMADKDGSTPMHVAVENDAELEIIEYLAKKYPVAVVARNKNGATPLHLALQEGCSLSKVKALVKAHDAALQVEDEEGRIPLHVALAADADAKILKLLAKTCPSSLTMRNEHGETPLQMARGQGIKDAELLALLRPSKS